MKIKVKPEGREDIYIPEKDSLKEWIKDKKWEAIHNFIPSSRMMIGADHSIESVLEDIDNCERLALLLGRNMNQNMGHALSLIENNKLEMYDIGTITKEDLEIT